MDRWNGRTAIVTGASSGMGSRMASDLVKVGMKVVGVARRVEVVQKLADSLKGSKGQLKPMKCDLTDPKQIEAVFQWAEKNWGGVHLLINNAGVLTMQPLEDCDPMAVKTMFDTNVVALCHFAKLAIQSMKKHGIEEGHIININSYVGHRIFGVPGMAPYCASKNAVTVLTESLRRELGAENSKIKVTSLSPGLVGTELSDTIHVPESAPRLDAQEVSDTVMYVISTPPGINVVELTVMKTGDVIY
ncbi:hypothetical protein GE061_016235 [Apolygus lucorum]|uniref:Uncharacterized protein n=1 Tax=Apolygus lucorum TaxID=248454 RepID=A0A6A4JYB4_APOLU|nr:hypothetical protein GE061_016235 [Apolygus lucorum]